MNEFTLEIRRSAGVDGFVMDFEPGKANARRFIAQNATEIGEWVSSLVEEYLEANEEKDV